MSDIDGMQESGHARESSLAAVMRQLRVDGGGPAGPTVEALLFATLGDLTDAYALDQTDLDDLGRMFGAIASDVTRGLRSADGWRAICELMAWVAMEDAEFPVTESEAWGYLASLRKVYATLPEAG